MMREDQIDPATMDVEHIAQISGAHRRALDVPARPSPAPRTFPSRLVARRLLPQYEVGWILLVRIDGDARARPLLVELAARQRAVIRPRGGFAQHFAAGL